MASSWIVTRTTAKGERRFRVEYRLGGREAPTRYGGSFSTKREALERKRWLAGELAGRRVPNLASLETVERPLLFSEAAQRWRDGRVDVTEGTRGLHRIALARALPLLGRKRLDEITVADINELVTSLHTAGSADAAKPRFGGRCALCDSDGPLNAHHRTYERVGNELPDLTALCADCHQAYHEWRLGRLVRRTI